MGVTEQSYLTEFRTFLKSGHDFIVLDTETTGLGRDAEIVQIALLWSNGVTLLDTLVKPVKPIPADATAIHGISDATVASAPTWATVRQQVLDLIRGKHVVVYNATYDRKLMHQSDDALALPRVDYKTIAAGFWCAMTAFAELYGEYNSYYGSYRWQPLHRAADYFGLTNPKEHNALSDCLVTLEICKALSV